MQYYSRDFSPQEIQLLRQVAVMEDPLAAYGRNLLYLVTGESLEPPMDESMEGFNGGPIAARGKKVETLSMHPNPASHSVSLEIDHYDYESPYKVEVSSFFGQAMTSQNALPVTTIETSHYPAGLYMVKVYKEGNLLFTKKLSVFK